MFSTLHEVEIFFNNRKVIGIKPGLARVEALLKRVGHPEKNLKAIHIAGTNGKGSTLHFLNAALLANDYHVGIFTSPSFTGLSGHILLNNQSISEPQFVTIMNQLYPQVMELDKQDMAPTEFEILTVAAFMFFAKNSEIVLVETGMGGRYDTTNTVLPILSIITNVSIDHTDYLGTTLKEIAQHKAGIIKENKPVIVGEMASEALDVIRAEAKSKKSELHILGESFAYEKEQLIGVNLKGKHQLKNISLARKALEVLEGKNFALDWKKARTAMNNLKLPGRFEMIYENPSIIVDAAHNIAGIQAFIDTVQSYDKSKEKHVIVGAFKDKDTEKMVNHLADFFTSVTLTTFDHPRAATASELLGKLDKDNVHKADDWQTVIQVSLTETDKSFYITGSLHFITLVRDYFHENRLDM